ncbi:MAG TPA: AEC family transporter [Candidatus Binatia bacterium]
MIDYNPLAPVIPVFTLIGVGFLFARIKKLSLAPITDFIIYLASPSLAFVSLSARPIFIAEIAMLLAGMAGILAGVGILLWLYRLATGFRSRGFALPVLFMNAGNMGIPLALFAFGEPGLQRATLLFVITALTQYSLGVYIASGQRGWQEVFRLPLIYAALLGLFVNLGEIQVPRALFESLRLLGYSTIPLMLVSLGCRLSSVTSITWGHSVAGALLRIVGGFACAYLTVTLLGMEGINRQIILLYGSLPSAVVNFVLTEKYRQDPELAASIILMTTLLSLVTIPVVFSIIQ